MTDLDDFEISKSGAPGDEGQGPEGPGGGFPLLAGVGVLVVALLGGLGYLAFRKPTPRPPAADATGPAPSLSSPSPVPTASKLPPLDQSDALVREKARGLSDHPQLALWLAAHGLIRRFVVVVQNVSEGQSPRTHLGFLAPKGSFEAKPNKGRLVIDPASYARYDAFADAVASLDAAGCQRLYALGPLLEVAYRELGNPEGGFDKTLASAIAQLLEVPVLEGDVVVRPVWRGPLKVYELADPRLESLTPAQKHVLRMGPRNLRKLQAKLRELSEALGLPKG